MKTTVNNALQIWPRLISTSKKRQSLVDFLGAYKDCISEISFFTGQTHSFEHGKVFDINLGFIKQAIPFFRERGFSVGVNACTTLGHIDEVVSYASQPQWRYLVGQDGKTVMDSVCPTDKAVLKEISRRYDLVGQCHPDFVWIDVDLRLIGHHPVEFGCFCDNCVKRFGDKIGCTFDRNELVKRLAENSSYVIFNELRQKWIDNNVEVLADVLMIIESVVHGVSPDTELGLMGGSVDWGYYPSSGRNKWLKILSGAKSKHVRYRYSGGFWREKKPYSLFIKACDVGRQVEIYGKECSLNQVELENFSYHQLMKSCHITMLESTCHLAAGGDGLVFNLISDSTANLNDYRGYLEGLRKYKPFWDKIVTFADGLSFTGLWIAMHPKHSARVRVEKWPEDLKKHFLEGPTELIMQMSLPIAAQYENSYGAVFTAETVSAFDQKELIAYLAKGVIFDAGCATHLQRLGLLECCGLKSVKPIDDACFEWFTTNQISPDTMDMTHDSRFRLFGNKAFGNKAYELFPANNAVVLSEYISHVDGSVRGAASVAFENDLGGRIVWLGNLPWEHSHTFAKSNFWMNISKWISYSQFPIYIVTSTKVVPFVRTSQTGDKALILLVNASFDNTGPFKIVTSFKVNCIALHSPESPQISFRSVARENCTEIEISHGMLPWSCHAMFLKNVT